MRLESKTLLVDIHRAAQLVFEFVAGMDYRSFCADQKTIAAVEREFLIIGEAVRRLSATDPECCGRIPNYRTVISFRNVLAHAYDRVESEVVWGVIQRDLVELTSTVAVMLCEDDLPRYTP